MTTFRRIHSLACLSCLCVVLAATGCRSLSQPGSASFASVKIANHSPAEIAQVTTQVFQADGYRGGTTGTGQMVFEKEGTRMNSFAYAGVADTYYGAQTVVRVRAEIVDLTGGNYRLQCQAYIVQDAGQGIFEEEQRLTNIRSGPYQSLLDKVEEQLK